VIRTTGRLSERLMSVAQQVHISEDLLGASLDGRTVEAEDGKELAARLSRLLYEAVHAGREEHEGPTPRTLRDAGFEELLAAATPHRTTVLPVRETGRRATSGHAVVEIDGVRVAVPDDALAPAAQDGRRMLTTDSVRPALSPGFFLVDSSRGRPDGRPLLRVYVHIAGPEHAPGVWKAVLTALEDHGVRYRAKISSSPLLYPRRDAMVVYLPPGQWDAVAAVAGAADGLPGRAPATSPFAHELAPGLSVAWEPEDHRPGRTGMSFGEHRALALAEGLVSHARSAGTLSLETAVFDSFAEFGIDPAQPARNVNSPAIPEIKAAEFDAQTARAAR
jgi:hypothetical protein